VTCGVVCCGDCIALHHEHVLGSIEKVREKEAPALLALVAVVQDGLPATIAAITKLRTAKDVVLGNKSAAESDAKVVFKAHQATLVKRRDGVLAEIGTVAKRKLAMLDDRINALEALHTTAEDGAALASRVLKHGSAAEVLVLHPTMAGGLGDVVALHAQLLAPTHMATHLQFIDTMPALGAVGLVDGCEIDLTQCTVAGDGAGFGGAVAVGAEVAFTVTVVDTNGTTATHPAILVRATLVRVEPLIVDDGGGGGGGAAAAAPLAVAAPAVAAPLAVAAAAVAAPLAVAAAAVAAPVIGAAAGDVAPVIGAVAAGDVAAVAVVAVVAAPLAGAGAPPPPLSITTTNDDAGRCMCTYTAPAKAGTWSLEVLVGGDHVRGSPFAVEVQNLIEFSGIKIEQDNLSSAALLQSGWTLSYQHLYEYKTTVAELDAVGGTKWLVAARRKGKDTLVVAAMGDRDVVLKRTRERAVAHEHNGAYWYCFEGNSFGFAPTARVNLWYADEEDQASQHRLSWFLDKDDGGWRAGYACNLDTSKDWEKLIFTA
jgi:hypothetical protein